MATKVTRKQKTFETTILQKLTYFFGGMFLYSIFSILLYQLIDTWGAILALVTGIVCSLILIIKKHRGSRWKMLAYGIITAWFMIAITFGMLMLYFIGGL